MPRWLARLVYAVRGKRRVRYHLDSRFPGGEEVTLEGLELGCWASHYVMLLPKHIKAEGQSIPLEGSVEIPRERVIYRQVLAA